MGDLVVRRGCVHTSRDKLLERDCYGKYVSTYKIKANINTLGIIILTSLMPDISNIAGYERECALSILQWPRLDDHPQRITHTVYHDVLGTLTHPT